jgi:hypothetical protein
MSSWRFTVNGHGWLVEQRADTPGCYDFDWLTAPNPGYGFTSTSSDGSPLDETQMTVAIAEFLAEVNPETGFLD